MDQLLLCRSHFKEGTNSALFYNGDFVCFMIELPWKKNFGRISCIPDGFYKVRKRYSQRLKHHFILEGVPQREYILIHPANDAMKELQGCLAPVSSLLGIGKGGSSRNALQKLFRVLEAHFKKKEYIPIEIISKDFTHYLDE